MKLNTCRGKLHGGLALMLLVPASLALAGSVTLPAVTVSGVTATTPVLDNTASIAVSATVTPTFDTGSVTSATANATCRGGNGGNNYCGTGNSSVTDQTVVTTTTVTIGGMQISAGAADFFSASAPAVLSGTAYSGTLATPDLAGADGIQPVAVTANVFESVTTVVTTVTTNKSCTKSGGVTTCNTVGDPTTTISDPVTVNKNASGSGSGSYILDIDPPTLSLQPVSSQPQVQQGSDKNLHNVLVGGSEFTPYTVIDTIVGPDGYTSSASGSGKFDQSPKNNGIANDKRDLVGVYIGCDAPVGNYTASAVANTVDLGGFPFVQISSTNSDSFVVTPGVSLGDQTQVVSELPPSGDYAPMSCFTAGMSGKKVSTFPGSLHVTATVNTSGACAGFATLSGTTVSLKLPVGFSFADSGGSPKAHVFVGPAIGGFDFHNPKTLAEVTALIPKPIASGQTVTVNLSTLDLGFGPGIIPATDTIYVRAHAAFSGTSVPPDGTPFEFATSTTSTLPGLGTIPASSSQTIVKNSACVSGN